MLTAERQLPAALPSPLQEKLGATNLDFFFFSMLPISEFDTLSAFDCSIKKDLEMMCLV